MMESESYEAELLSPDQRVDLLARILFMLGGVDEVHFTISEGKCSVKEFGGGYHLCFVPTDRTTVNTPYTFAVSEDGTDIEAQATVELVHELTPAEEELTAAELIKPTDKFMRGDSTLLDYIVTQIRQEYKLEMTPAEQKLFLLYKAMPKTATLFKFEKLSLPYSGNFGVERTNGRYAVVYRPRDAVSPALGFELNTQGEPIIYIEQDQITLETESRAPSDADKVTIENIYSEIIYYLSHREEEANIVTMPPFPDPPSCA